MIRPHHIQQQAHRDRVIDSQVEKDYVLSWVLYGISAHDALSRLLAFKGGTLLKKVYFADYRYSEDLDFTLLNEQCADPHILTSFADVFAWVAEKANIPLTPTASSAHSSGSIHFHIHYQGPLGGRKAHKRLKVDITRGERLVFAPAWRQALPAYDDVMPFGLLCYQIEEVLIEKMCALVGRTEPRDLYDLWYLLEIAGMDITHHWSAFVQKATHKGHTASEFADRVAEKLARFEGRWHGSLAAQIHALPTFCSVARDVRKHLRKVQKL